MPATIETAPKMMKAPMTTVRPRRQSMRPVSIMKPTAATAMTAAVIAVAAVGFMMLTGRMDWRRGLTVVIGAFIVFGAVSIVAGIRSMATGLH